MYSNKLSRIFKGIVLSKTLLGLFFLITITGCEEFFTKEVDNINLPGADSQLVAFAYIAPSDSLIKVHISRSIPYIDNGQDLTPIGDKAIVGMARKGENFKELTYNAQCQCYTISTDEMQIEAGYDYSLLVEYKDMKVDASCFVPVHLIGESHLQIDPFELVSDEYGSQEIKLTWQITPPVSDNENYYFSGAFVKSYGVFKENGTFDTLYMQSYEMYLDRGEPYFADSEGKTYRFRSTYWSYFGGYPGFDDPSGEYPSDIIDSAFIYVLQTDYNYYQFHKSYDTYNNADGNPFAEIVQIYTNIEGGLGVFGGYNKKEIAIPFALP
jgi:hypothetical protein